MGEIVHVDPSAPLQPVEKSEPLRLITMPGSGYRTVLSDFDVDDELVAAWWGLCCDMIATKGVSIWDCGSACRLSRKSWHIVLHRGRRAEAMLMKGGVALKEMDLRLMGLWQRLCEAEDAMRMGLAEVVHKMALGGELRAVQMIRDEMAKHQEVADIEDQAQPMERQIASLSAIPSLALHAGMGGTPILSAPVDAEVVANGG